MKTETLRRTIHPVCRVLDDKNGIVEYIASNETIDSYNEIIRADGWQFNRFQKNAPFVDSHNYASIDCLLGKVLDFKVQGKNLVETVKWAIDVPTNELAIKGFAMTQAGYLKAVSVGFMPTRYCSKWDSDPTEYNEQCEDLGIKATDNVRTIYTRQEQLELSACVIGANPDAVANVEKALKAGILDDQDIEQFARMNPAFGREFEKRGHKTRSYSFGTSNGDNAIENMTRALGIKPEEIAPAQQKKITTKDDMLKQFRGFNAITRHSFEQIESARSGGNEGDITRAVQVALVAQGKEHRGAFGNPIERYLNADPERRYFWDGVMRLFGLRCAGNITGFSKSPLQKRALDNYLQKGVSGIAIGTPEVSSLFGGAGFGYGLLANIPIADELYDLLLHYGQYKYLGLRKMTGAFTQYAEVTGYPNAVVINPPNIGTVTIPDDTQYSGTFVTPNAATIASIIKCSAAWLNDEKVDFSNVIVSKIVMGLASRIDYCAFLSNGQGDQNNTMNTGLFMNNQVKVFTTVAGKNAVAQLERSDFINTIALVNPAALQRMEEQPPRWYIHPSYIPQLLMLWDGEAHNYLLKTPAETQGEWMLCGFPVSWTAQAPVIGTPNALGLFAFGNPDAYIVSLQENFEVTSAEGGAEFADISFRFRALARGNASMRDATGFALLNLAAAPA